MTNIISIAAEPCYLKVDYVNGENRNHILLDVVESQLFIESICATEDTSNAAIVGKVQKWFHEKTGADLGVSQAWTLFCSIQPAYAIYKKKLSGMLNSLNFSGSIASLSRTPESNSSTELCQDSPLSGNSGNDKSPDALPPHGFARSSTSKRATKTKRKEPKPTIS